MTSGTQPDLLVVVEADEDAYTTVPTAAFSEIGVSSACSALRGTRRAPGLRNDPLLARIRTQG